VCQKTQKYDCKISKIRTFELSLRHFAARGHNWKLYYRRTTASLPKIYAVWAYWSWSGPLFGVTLAVVPRSRLSERDAWWRLVHACPEFGAEFGRSSWKRSWGRPVACETAQTVTDRRESVGALTWPGWRSNFWIKPAGVGLYYTLPAAGSGISQDYNPDTLSLTVTPNPNLTVILTPTPTLILTQSLFSKPKPHDLPQPQS